MDTVLTTIKQKSEVEFFRWIPAEMAIRNDDELKNASDLLAVGKSLYKKAEADLKDITAPLRDQEKQARESYKPLLSRIDLGIGILDKAILDYHRKKKEFADALLIIQAQEQAAKIAEAKETGEVVEMEQAIVQPVTNTIKGNMGTTGIRETAEFTIVDESLVPAELKTTDLKKVKAWYALGHKDIPGILVTIKQITVSRFV